MKQKLQNQKWVRILSSILYSFIYGKTNNVINILIKDQITILPLWFFKKYYITWIENLFPKKKALDKMNQSQLLREKLLCVSNHR